MAGYNPSCDDCQTCMTCLGNGFEKWWQQI